MKKNIISLSAFYIMGALMFINSSFLALAAPADISGDIQLTIEDNNIVASWFAVEGVEASIDHYRIYIDTKSVGDLETYAEIIDTPNNTNSYTIKDFQSSSLVDGEEYFLSVTAVDTLGVESINYSDEASVIYVKTEVIEEIVEPVDPAETVSEPTSEEAVVPTETNSETDSSTNEGDINSNIPSDLDSVISDTQTLIENEVVPVSVENIEEQIVEALEEELHEAAKKDLKAPEDIRNFRSSYKLNDSEENYTVNMEWKESLDTDNDLNHYNYAQKAGASDYSNSIQISKDKTSYQKVLGGGERYTFKISSVDTNGNESTGAISSIILPETGPGMILALTLIFSLAGAYVIRRKELFHI
jgi:hypothetical protein